MPASTRKLITIVTESALEQNLVDDIERLGAHGYTITNTRGKGHRGVRSADWGTSSNIRVEVICDTPVATAITAHLQEHYFKNYAMVVFQSDVDVLRAEKF